MDLFGGILIFHIYVLLEVIWKPCITNDWLQSKQSCFDIIYAEPDHIINAGVDLGLGFPQHLWLKVLVRFCSDSWLKGQV